MLDTPPTLGLEWLARRMAAPHSALGGARPAAADLETIAGRIWMHDSDVLMTPVVAEHGFWEPELGAFFERWLRPGMTVVDVGANIGYFAVMAARMVGPEGRVVAIEPEADNLALLGANLWRNRCQNATVVPLAAYSRTGEIVLVVNEDSRAACVVDPHATEGLRVPCTTLDDLLGGAPLDVLKIDAEGSDIEVLRGARACLAASPDPVVIVELWSEFTPERMLADYRAEGFELHLFHADGTLHRASLEQALDAAAAVTYMNLGLRRP